jgi:hypothetical protein
VNKRGAVGIFDSINLLLYFWHAVNCSEFYYCLLFNRSYYSNEYILSFNFLSSKFAIKYPNILKVIYSVYIHIQFVLFNLFSIISYNSLL